MGWYQRRVHGESEVRRFFRNLADKYYWLYM